MKKFLLFVAVVVAMASCAHETCPTYRGARVNNKSLSQQYAVYPITTPVQRKR